MDAEPTTPGDDRGIRCRKCGGGHFLTIETRKLAGKRVMRRRQCRDCGQRVTTHERAFGSA